MLLHYIRSGASRPCWEDTLHLRRLISNTSSRVGHTHLMGHPGLPEPKSCCHPACLSKSVLCIELASPWVGGGQRLLASGMPITAFCSLVEAERDVRRNTHRGFVCGGSRGGSVVVLCTPGGTGRRKAAAVGLVGSPPTLRTGSEDSLIDWEGKGAGLSRAHYISNTYVHSHSSKSLKESKIKQNLDQIQCNDRCRVKCDQVRSRSWSDSRQFPKPATVSTAQCPLCNHIHTVYNAAIHF